MTIVKIIKLSKYQLILYLYNEFLNKESEINIGNKVKLKQLSQ